MKFIDCSACIGESSINRKIVNHENYPVFEKVKQPKNAKELLAEMDFNGIDEAIVYNTAMLDVAPNYGNNVLLSNKENYTGRLHATLTVLPTKYERDFQLEKLINTMKTYKVVGLRAFPKDCRFMLDKITCGDLLDYMISSNLPLYLSPQDGWEMIFNVLKEFPKLTVIITNYGLWGSDRYVYPLVDNYENVYIDTSDFQEIIGIQAFVERFGSEKMLFGTNYPMCNMGGPIATLMGAKISIDDKENIAHRNIERLINSIKL